MKKELRRESELKKIIDDFGQSCKKRKHKFFKTDIVINEIEVDSVEIIAPYGEGFRKEKYNISSSNKFLKPYEIEIIDTMHRNYSNIKAKYNNLFFNNNAFN